MTEIFQASFSAGGILVAVILQGIAEVQGESGSFDVEGDSKRTALRGVGYREGIFGG